MGSVVMIGLAVLGVCLGSFVNALVWRLHELEKLGESMALGATERRQKLSISRGRSMCPHCGQVLGAKDLVPIVSWVFLRGKCRYCHAPIDDTPIPELLGGVLFVLSYIFWPFPFTVLGVALLAVWLGCLVCMLALAVYDARWYILPTKLIIVLSCLAGLFAVLRIAAGGVNVAAIATVSGAVLLLWGLFRLIYAISPKLIGFGDVRLAVPLALLAGSPLMVLVLLFVASFVGTLLALPLLVSGRKTLKQALPFGPFLLLGCVVAVLFGSDMLRWLDTTLFYVG
ncbi:MAG: prepilin peptidase [Candidatus Saccharimonadales bacterium]